MTKNKKVMIELPEDLHRDVKVQCATQSITITDFIVDAVKKAIKELENK